MSTALPQDVPVLIVGGGPVGLTAACLLRQRGVECLVISRELTTSRSPRAHVINRRTMEVFREMGIADAVTAAGTPPQSMRDVIWAKTLSDATLARYVGWGMSVERLRSDAALSAERVVNLPQHRLEPMLLDAAQKAGATVRLGYEATNVHESSDSVTVQVRGPQGDEQNLRCRYLIAADGGKSRIRDVAGLKLAGEGGMRTAVSAFFKADLSAEIQGRHGLLYLLLHPAATGVMIGARVPDEWVFMYPLPPGADPAQFGLERMTALIQTATGRPDLAPDIVDIQSWRTNALVAERYATNRIFLVGDAAHLNSPTGGLGMNTGIQDAHNLAWKLQAVMERWAGEEVLASYDEERRPVGRINIEQSLRNLMLLGRVREALGLTAVPTTDLSPEVVAARLAEAQVRSVSDLSFGAQLRNAVNAQFEQFDAIGIDLGFVYPHGAVCVEDEAAADPSPVGCYVPTTAPGARLPHAIVEYRGRMRSTHDLVETNGLTLLHGDGGAAWRAVAADVAHRFSVPITCIGIGGASEAFDRYGQWLRDAQLSPEGAALVRPDRHVLWRSREVVNAERLAKVVDRALRIT